MCKKDALVLLTLSQQEFASCRHWVRMRSALSLRIANLLQDLSRGDVYWEEFLTEAGAGVLKYTFTVIDGRLLIRSRHIT